MYRPVTHTYQFIRQKLAFCPPMSTRKRMCLSYLRWVAMMRREDRHKFVELAKLWRKEDARIGSPRTLLEKKARRMFAKVRKETNREKAIPTHRSVGRKNKRQRTGIHSPEWQASIQERNEALTRHRLKHHSDSNAHYWKIIPPEGEPFIILNLRKFCREHNLNSSHMCQTAMIPPRRKTHKGWRAEKYDPEWSNYG